MLSMQWVAQLIFLPNETKIIESVHERTQRRNKMRNPMTDMARIGSLITIIAASLFLNTPSLGQEPSLEERVSTLERKVSLLEEAVLRLTLGKPAEKVPEVAPPPPAMKGTWRSLENWRTHLKFGMTEAEVRELMGPPDIVEKMALIGKVWYYGDRGGGSINFTIDGKVKSWLEPPSDQLK
jgi:hypothetical protein